MVDSDPEPEKPGAYYVNRIIQLLLASLALLYVATVLIADTLAAERIVWIIEWRDLHWQPGDLHRWLWSITKDWGVSLNALSWLHYRQWQSFDLFKFTFWLVLPFLFCLPRMEWGWLSPLRMQARDWLGLLFIAAAGAGAMKLIPMVPELRQLYPALSHLPGEARWEYFQAQLMWTLSWLIGWEFLHRYLLLRAGNAISSGWGWLLVPLVEGLYHLQKPLLEAVGMVTLSVVLTQWTLRRRTLIPALLAHFVIELQLLGYQLL